MAGISIPGVSDKYKTNDLVEGLMKAERIPLTREQNTLETYKAQQDAWRTVNQKLSTLRDSVKTLYSFDNPFNNKLTSSTDENAVTATANRDAAYESFKIDVITPATQDRLLSKEIAKDENVPEGTYTFKTGDKTVTMKWRGGKVEDFVSALNKRGTGIIKAGLIGVNKGNKALLIESMKTGSANKLVFEDDALKFAIDKEMIKKVSSKNDTFGTKQSEIKTIINDPDSANEQEGLPRLDSTLVKVTAKGITVGPRGGAIIDIPSKIKGNENGRIDFSLTATEIEDITEDLNSKATGPELPEPGKVDFSGVTIFNEQTETGIVQDNTEKVILNPVKSDHVLFAVMDDGSEKEIALPEDALSGKETKFSLDLRNYPGLSSIAVRNRNTGLQINLSGMTGYDAKTASGYQAVHPVSEAGDAVIKYEGITITRPENEIDDVVPNVTLHLNDKTERTATISIKPDTESAKDALINFVGKYNQAVAEMNILSQNKPEIIAELDYLTSEEKEEYQKKLGMFFSDFSLSSAKGNLQQIIAAQYNFSQSAEVTMLSQIGISTNASNYAGYNPGKMRGYLEIDEKKLDEKLENNLDEVKNIFGFDSDGDLIIDSGIGYRMDKQLTAYVQSGGILANKTSILDRQIKASETKIAKLETQLDEKEAELKMKYGQMESTLNNLESQQNSINNFANQNNRGR